MLRLLILLFILVLAAACSPAPSADTPTTAPTTVSTVPPDSPTIAPTVASLPLNDAGLAVVARVNGADITLPQFERALARAQQESVIADPTLLRLTVLDTLIEQMLIDQAATQMNIVVSDEEINTELQTNIQLAGGQQAWEGWLTTNQYTEAEFRDTLRATLITSRVRDAVTQDESSSPTIEEVHARHILVRTEAEANDILARLQAGEDFATLASLSLDVSTRDSGGDLDWFTRDDLVYVPALADVAFSLEPGQIAGPVPTRLGYHVIQTLEVRESTAEVQDQALLAQERFERWLDEQRTNATIERFI